MINTLRTVLIAAVLLLPRVASAQPEPATEPRAERQPLVVATKEAPPFVIETDGEVRGLSIDLWKRVADSLGREFEFRVMSLEESLSAVQNGNADAAVAAISITPDREEAMDLSHGYFTSGLGIAVSADTEGSPWLRAAGNLFTWGFASAVLALAVLLLVVGVLVWFVESRGNEEQFQKDPKRGIGDGFWFAAVTMTTVGYGDKAPRTLAGRALSLVWMFASIIVISAFTGAIASSLTAAEIAGTVRGVDDLRSARVGTIGQSASDAALRGRGVTARRYDSVEEGLRAVAEGRIDAFVHDWPILQYQIMQDFPGEVRVLEARFEPTQYAIALPNGSELREPINRAILEITREPDWGEVVAGYLGK